MNNHKFTESSDGMRSGIPAGSSAEKTPRWALWTLALILLVGLGLRVYFSSIDLTSKRYWDERYSQMNVVSLLEDKTFEPANTYYPYPCFNVPGAVAVGLTQKIYEVTGDRTFRAIRLGKFRPAGYFSARIVQALFGVLGIWLLFLIGRRMFSWEVGLLAALTLTFMAWHIHSSSIFKPDAQLLTSVLLAFYLSLRAVERPTLATYLLAGVGIALAMSAKLTGGLIALALVVGTVATGWRDLRRLGLLCAAGVMSAGTFIALNPWWWAYPKWLASLERDYAMRAAWSEWTRWQVPGRVVDFLIDPWVLGPVLGSLGLITLGFVVVALFRKGWQPDRRDGLLMLSAFVIAYVAAYTVKTPYFKPNNFLPVVPFLCLTMAWPVASGWRRLVGRLQGGRSAPVSAAPVSATLVSGVLALVVPVGLTYIYRTVVPTTMDVALAQVGRAMRKGTDGRIILIEETPYGVPAWDGEKPFLNGKVPAVMVESIADLDPEKVWRMDALIFPASRAGQEIEIYDDFAGSEWAKQYVPKAFSVRGPPLVAFVNQWRREDSRVLESRLCPTKKGCLEIDIRGQVRQGEYITVRIMLHGRSKQIGETDVVLKYGRQVIELTPVRGWAGRYLASPRFRSGHPGSTILIESPLPFSSKARPEVHLFKWRKPKPGRARRLN